MVLGLLALLMLGVLQLGLALFVRNTVADAAAEGARSAVVLGGSGAAAEARTRQLVEATLSGYDELDVAVERDVDGSAEWIVVTARGQLPMLGTLGIVAFEETGRAVLPS